MFIPKQAFYLFIPASFTLSRRGGLARIPAGVAWSASWRGLHLPGCCKAVALHRSQVVVAIREGVASRARAFSAASLPRNPFFKGVAFVAFRALPSPFLKAWKMWNPAAVGVALVAVVGDGLAGGFRSMWICKNQNRKSVLFALPKSVFLRPKILTIANLHYFNTLHFFLFNIIKVIRQNLLFHNLLTFNKLENKVH